jgi:hypothetical protein
MNDRKLRVTFDLSNSTITTASGAPFTESSIVVDETQFISVQGLKTIDSIQNHAVIEIINLRSDLRAALLSQMTAFNRRQISGPTSDPILSAQAALNFVGITVEAGYQVPQSQVIAPYAYNAPTNSQSFVSAIFSGEVALVEPTGVMPNQGVRITAFTHQVDRTLGVSTMPPQNATFKAMVAWAADQMGMNYSCNTQFDSQVKGNVLTSIPNVGGLPSAIAQLHAGDIAAYIDDNLFIVTDIDKAINPNDITDVYEFINLPMWTEWGCKFTTFFTPNLQLMHVANLHSALNPSLNSTDWIVSTIEYSLTSRDTPFYVTASCHPASAVASGAALPVPSVGG